MLRAADITVALGGRTVVHGVTLDARPGECIALLGPNGAGKSTLLRAIAGLIPSTGTVEIAGTPLAAMPRAKRARTVAWLAQGGEAAWPMSVRAVAALGRQPHGGGPDDPAVARALAAADAVALAARPLTALSGGERARALLARALAVEAPLLLADEPVAALDPYHQLQVMETLRDEAAIHGRTVIAVLHDLTLALRFCTRVILMREGRLLADQPTAEALSPALIEQVYGVTPLAGIHEGKAWAIPWTRV